MAIRTDIHDLRRLVKDDEERLKELNEQHQRHQRQLADLEKTCSHDWGKDVYDPIVTPAGHFAGDPVGTMGVDRQLPCSWPERREPRWTRTCKNCGHTEKTTHVRAEPRPQW